MKREFYITQIHQQFEVQRAVALLGPRQCGKTTLALMFAEEEKELRVHHFDLEDPADLVQLENPMLALSHLEGLIIIDEIQRRPELFPVLRVLIDKKKEKQKFLILGSASRDLIQQSSETLAGRIGYLEVKPFSLIEVEEMRRLWIRGGFPLSYLSSSEIQSFRWLKNYITTFLERDIPSLGIRVSPNIMRRFWMMLTHYHGNTFNASEIGRSLGISHPSVRHYVDILSGTFMVRELQPWYENISKRQVKNTKIYFRDSGIYHSLLGTHSEKQILVHPKLGASWEGFALEEIIRIHNASPEECYFWGIHAQAEIDLLIVKDGRKNGFEIKYMDAPRVTRSMLQALEILNLDSLNIVYPGEKEYTLKEGIKVIPLSNLISQLT